MSDLKWKGLNQLMRERSFHRKKENSHKMKADAIEREIVSRGEYTVPECYASKPNAQAQAENGCEDCPHRASCFRDHRGTIVTVDKDVSIRLKALLEKRRVYVFHGSQYMSATIEHVEKATHVAFSQDGDAALIIRSITEHGRFNCKGDYVD